MISVFPKVHGLFASARATIRVSRPVPFLVALTAVAVASFLCSGGNAALELDASGARDPYDERVDEYLHLCVHGDTLGSPGLYTEIARMELGEGPLDPGVIERSLDLVRSRQDCSDFHVAGLLRIACQYADSPLLDSELLEDIEQVLLEFKYWIDEPGSDSMCYWSENHQILYHSAEYLVGQLFPDDVFPNSGLTGWEHVDNARPRIEKWLERRFYIGFSEWHSNVYYEMDIAAVLNLADFASDEEIALRAAMIADILLFDVVVNSHRGVFGASHGRSYGDNVTGGRGDHTACVSKLVSGEGTYNSRSSMSAVTMGTSRSYRPPGVIQSVGADHPDMLVNRECMGIHLWEACKYGLTFEDFESCMFWWGMGAYFDWRAVNLTFDVIDFYNLWENGFFAPLELLKPFWEMGLLPWISACISDIAGGSVLSQVDTYSYRTPDYMLAAAQDQRPGEMGYQQHTWQATMGRDAVIFTSHPGSYSAETPGYWTGGWKPKVVQEKNVLIAMYEWKPSSMVFPDVVIPYTHAYVPQYAFDELHQDGHWLFGRSGDAYFALYSDRPTRWVEGGEWAGVDLIADGTPNIWICEMGRREVSGTFENFISDIQRARLHVLGTCVIYHSPTVGRMKVGLLTPLSVNRRLVRVHGYPRFDNPYIDLEFGGNPAVFTHGCRSLVLDFETPERIVED